MGMMQHMQQNLEAEVRGSHSDMQGGHGRTGFYIKAEGTDSY